MKYLNGIESSEIIEDVKDLTSQLAQIVKSDLRYLYNPKHLKGLKRYLAEKASVKNIIFMGDSITEGQIATVDYGTNGYVGLVAAYLKSLYNDGRNEFYPSWQNKIGSTPRWTYIGMSTNNSLSVSLNTNGTGIFTPPTSYAQEAFALTKSGGGTLRSNYGGSNANIATASEDPPALVKTAYPGAVTQGGPCTVTAISASVDFVGVRFYKSGSSANGIAVHNLGKATVNGSDWLDPAGNGIVAKLLATELQSKLAFIAFGANDWNNQTAVADYKAAITDMVTHLLSIGSYVVLLVNGEWSNEIAYPKTISHLLYENALYEIADEQNVALIDVSEKWRIDATRASFLADPVHPNNAGHQSIADTITNCILKY